MTGRLPLPMLVSMLVLSCLLASVAISSDRDAARSDQGFSRRTIEIRGIARTYRVRAPAKGKAPTAIVVMLHGHGGSAERLTGEHGGAAPYRRWNAIADREGLLLVAAQGLAGGDGKAGWNDCRADADSNPETDDVGFLVAMIAALRREYVLQSGRTYAIGSSNGGQMALRLAIEQPGSIDAVAVAVGSLPARSECVPPMRPAPAVFFNGTDDPLLPFAGGCVGQDRFERGTVLSTEATLARWARLTHASPNPLTRSLPDLDGDDGTRATRVAYLDASDRPTAMLYRIEGGGHLEPSRSERYRAWLIALLGRQNGDIEMADEAWAFFREHGR
jgi:polyhydroxybutyrate depolymerase